MSRIIERNDANRAREINAGCRLKWCWEWLQKEVTIKHQGTSLNTTLGEFYWKVDAAGKARCLLYDETKYAARGSQALLDHVRSQHHAKNLSAKRTTSKMRGNFFTPRTVSEVKQAATYGINPVFLKAAAAADSATVQPAVPEPKRLTPFQDLKAHVEALSHMVSVAADPKELLTKLGIASVLQDSLLETIEASQAKSPHVNVSCLM